MGKAHKRVDTPETDTVSKATGLRNADTAPDKPEGLNESARTGRGAEQVLARDAAGYIHEMAIELKDMAESARMSFLAYLLDLVIEESAMQKRERL